MPNSTEPVLHCHLKEKDCKDVDHLGYFGHTLVVPSPSSDNLPSLASATTSPTSPSKRPVKVQCEVRTRIPSEYCETPHSLLLYSNDVDSEEHMALVFGYEYSALPGTGIWSRSLERVVEGETARDRYVRGAVPEEELGVNKVPSLVFDDQIPLARIHSCCFTGETLGSVRCDCREQLIQAMKLMAAEGRGVILYLKQEGRGIGLRDKMKAYNLIDQGFDTHQANLELGHPADGRSYIIATAILRDLQIPSVRLLTNNPHKVHSIVQDGVVVSERVPMVPASWTNGDLTQSGSSAGGGFDVLDRDEYLVTKVQKMGHILDIPNEILAGTASRNSPNTKRVASVPSTSPQK
ncbi:GTP cyclohydrolase II [Rhizoclosmatium sp. JEL0117]|nr:GTP cyclohydrolase II [Rhizoclosmatium sp. JEL0117]